MGNRAPAQPPVRKPAVKAAKKTETSSKDAHPEGSASGLGLSPPVQLIPQEPVPVSAGFTLREKEPRRFDTLAKQSVKHGNAPHEAVAAAFVQRKTEPPRFALLDR